MFRNSLAVLALLALCGSASAQEEVIGGGVYRPSASMIQPVFATFNLPSGGTSSAAQFGGVVGFQGSGGFGAGALSRAVPIAAPGKVTGLEANLSATQVGAAVVDNITDFSGSSADKTLGCAIPSGVAPPAANCSNNNADSVSGGDDFAWHWTVSAGNFWTQPSGITGPQQASFLFVPTDGQTGVLLGGAQTSPTVLGTVADQYVPFGSGGQSSSVTSEANGEVIANEPITITGFFATPNATTGTTGQVLGICVNGTGCIGAPIRMICTFANSSAHGCCATASATAGDHIPGTSGACATVSAISLNAGDTFSVHVFCSNTAQCSNIFPGFSVRYTPSVPGHAMMVAQISAGVFQTNSTTTNFNDGLANSSPINYGIAPFLNGKALTFSNLMMCSSTAMTGIQQRTVTSQAATTPGTTPTTVAGATTVSISSTNSPPSGSNFCDGVHGNTALVTGNRDATDSWTAGSGYSVDNDFTAANITTGSALYKASMTAVVH